MSILGSSMNPTSLFSNRLSNPFNSAYLQNNLGSTDSIIWPAIAVIILLFVIITIIYVVIRYRRGTADKQIKGPISLFTPESPIVLDRDTVTKYLSGSYTLSFYLQIDDVPDMRTASMPLFTWPKVWNMNYSPSTEQMHWVFTQTPTQDGAASETVTISNVPLQRWIQIAMVFEGRSVDLFVNGTLVKSELLNNLPTAANSSITIVPNNVMGTLAWIQLWSRRLSISEITTNYMDTSDSQGRPYLNPEFFSAFTGLRIPNLFCPNGNCFGAEPTCSQAQTWEFPYA